MAWLSKATSIWTSHLVLRFLEQVAGLERNLNIDQPPGCRCQLWLLVDDSQCLCRLARFLGIKETIPTMATPMLITTVSTIHHYYYYKTKPGHPSMEGHYLRLSSSYLASLLAGPSAPLPLTDPCCAWRHYLCRFLLRFLVGTLKSTDFSLTGFGLLRRVFPSCFYWGVPM